MFGRQYIMLVGISQKLIKEYFILYSFLNQKCYLTPNRSKKRRFNIVIFDL